MLYILLVLFLLVGGVLTVVTIQNFFATTHLAVFIWQTPELPVGLLVLFAFLLGALLLYLVSIFSALNDKREITRLNKRVEELEQKVTTNISPVSSSLSMQTPPVMPVPEVPAPPSQSSPM